MSRPVELTIYTFKEGLLSAVAHDLKITASATLHRDGAEVRLEVDPRSLRVQCAMKDGEEAPEVLSARDRKKIDKLIVSDVLAVRRHPTLRYTGTIEGDHVVGSLELAGTRRSLQVPWQEQDGGGVAGEVRLDQRDFGITPYKAMLGTLKVQPQVRIAYAF